MTNKLAVGTIFVVADIDLDNRYAELLCYTSDRQAAQAEADRLEWKNYEAKKKSDSAGMKTLSPDVTDYRRYDVWEVLPL